VDRAEPPPLDRLAGGAAHARTGAAATAPALPRQRPRTAAGFPPLSGHGRHGAVAVRLLRGAARNPRRRLAPLAGRAALTGQRRGAAPARTGAASGGIPSVLPVADRAESGPGAAPRQRGRHGHRTDDRPGGGVRPRRLPGLGLPAAVSPAPHPRRAAGPAPPGRPELGPDRLHPR